MRKPEITILEPFQCFAQRKRFKVAYGGRGGGRSWSIARLLLIFGKEYKLTILCTRQHQVSINNSVYRLLVEQIGLLHGMKSFYSIQKTTIVGKNGTQFIFRGLQNMTEIKSLEGVDICWVEEAENVSRDSWDYLIPTIRKRGSEIWVSFNPDDEEGETYRRFVKEADDSMLLVKTTYKSNPFISEEIEKQALHDREHDYEKYLWLWEGEPRRFTEALVFRGKFSVEEFETPEDAEFFFGADFGFAQGPSTLIRMWIKENTLYIDYEAYSVGVEIDDLPGLYDTVPGSRKWKIIADSERPDTIQYLARRGFNIVGAKKGAGSVEEGVELIKAFDRIVIHPRCPNTGNEFKCYRYKRNSITGEVIPILGDRDNHAIDSIRYALEPIRRGGPRVWAF